MASAELDDFIHINVLGHHVRVDRRFEVTVVRHPQFFDKSTHRVLFVPNAANMHVKSKLCSAINSYVSI
jgi:hypothetical protein